jgi:phage shock protein A
MDVLHAEHADPRVQLEQALNEAKAQHLRLTEQASNVIAHQQQVQRRLDRVLGDLERADASARHALRMSDEEARKGSVKAPELLQAAEAFADRVLLFEREIEGLEQDLLQATRAADEAKASVRRNAEMLRRRLADREKLLSALDQAKMQEQVNAATAQLSSTVGDLVPTVADVRHKIEARLAKAQGVAELADSAIDPIDRHLVEVERAQRTASAQARITQMRAAMGLSEPIDVVAVEHKAVGR